MVAILKNQLKETFTYHALEEVEVVAENGSMDSARESELINNEENVGGLNTSNATEGETHQLKNKGKTAEVGPSIAVYPVAVEANKTPLPQFGSTYTAEKLEKHFDEDYSFTSKVLPAF
ncbi:hypothetical protein HDU92_004853 [Lobulomyces angularis]|nr:hypothetical protein HDU92_004853 [Lobulomyces angularis]